VRYLILFHINYLGVPHKSNFFFFGNEPIWLAHCKKKFKLWRLPKIEDSMERWSASPFGPPIQVRSGRLWANHSWLKWVAIGNTLAEHIENLGNSLGTKGKWNISSPPPHPNPKLKRKRIKALWVHAEPSHWLHEK